MSTWNGLGSIDLGNIEEDRGGATLAAGAHVCRITDAELKKTKNGKGQRLAVTLTSLDGAGHVTDYMNVHNASTEAMEIGQRRLKTMLVKAGYTHATPDIAKMKGLQVGVHVIQGPDWQDNQGDTRKGGGEPRQSNPYFSPSSASNVTPIGVMNTSSAPTDEDGFGDGIPF
jgi:hypothetical protein|tara:strand:+ start:552 stop:1064 length:513 start_codon:yes stop_codon:yes gene_type:complete